MAPGNWIELNVHYNGVYVFLSYLVSVVGAWTTLEMMLKRTGSTGLWNVMLLIGAGIAFGSTATFGMHFVGNQAVTLRLPSPWEGRGVPLSYNAGYTILSLVVSCLSMILAFSFIGLRLSVPRWRSRLTDEEHGSTNASEKSVTREGEAYEDEVPDLRDNGFGEQKSPDLVSTGGAFDPDLKIDNGQQTRFALPAGRKMSLPTAFNIHLPKRGSKEEQEREKRRQEEEDEEDDKSEDGGDFGVHAASVSRWGVFKVLMAGIVCGGGIAAMHYVGQVSINSVPRVTNNWYTVLLSVIIAMACVSVGLYILFVIFRPKLEHSWYKRVIVAMILGVGVTLMHFVALLGTHYWAIEGQPLQSGNNNGTKTLIIALICVVAPVCCILLLIFAYFAQQRILRQRLARHRIILSTAIFDNQGLLLVQPESGLLPSAKIYPSKSNEQEKVSFLQMFGIGNRLSLQASKLKLARSDPAFIAFLKMSWAWRSKRGPVAGGTSAAFAGAPALEQESAYGGPGSRSGEDGISSPRLSEAEDEMTGSEAEIMRRSVLSFEMASEEIAMQLTGENDLKVLGVMYDSILKIGHFQVSSKSSGDKFTVTQGQMLVLARRLKNNAEREALVARGFVFAEPGAVARVTSNAYAVPVERVFDYYRDVYRFTRFGIVKRLDRGRLYGGLLMLQALPGEGLHVVVDERQHHSLPMTELAALVNPKCDRSKFASYPHAIATLEDTVEALEELGGKSLLELVNTATGPNKDAAGQLCDAIVKTLRPHIERILSPENLNVLLSRINVAPQLVPLTSRAGPLYGGEGLVKDSYLICLKAVVPSSVTLPGARLSWLPFPLYQAQSDCVSKASGSTVSGPRPNTGGSVAEAARFGGGWSASSQASAGRKASVVSDHFGDSDLPFGTSSAAPFTSSAFPSGSASPLPSPPATSLHPLHTFNAPTGPSGQRGSTYTTSSNNEDEDDSPHSPRPMTGPQAADLPEGVPVYSPDWIVGLVRDAVRAPGHTMSHWDVQRADRKAKPRRSE